MADKDVKQILTRLAQDRGLKESLYDGVSLSNPYLRQLAEVAQTMVESGATRQIETPQKMWGLLAQAVKVLMVVIKDLRDVNLMTSEEIYYYLKETLPQYSDKLEPELRDWLLTKFDTNKKTISLYIRKFLREYSQESKKPRKRTKQPSEGSLDKGESLPRTPGEVAEDSPDKQESLTPKLVSNAEREPVSNAEREPATPKRTRKFRSHSQESKNVVSNDRREPASNAVREPRKRTRQPSEGSLDKGESSLER